MSEPKYEGDTLSLVGEFDGYKWAKMFMHHWGHRKTEINTELMHAWFANAIMAGYDYATKNRPTR